MTQSYVVFSAYNSDGSSLGSVQVEHGVKQIDEERQQITQTFTSSDLPAAHALNDLLGTHSYQRQHAAYRELFKGPSLTMTAVHYGGILIGQGFMPQAGFNVTLLEATTAEHTYLYYELKRAAEPIALLIGVQSSDGHTLRGVKWPGMQSLRWQGIRERFTQTGHLLASTPLLRRYNGLQLEDYHAGQRTLTLELELWAPYYIVSGGMLGIAKLYDWALSIDAVDGPSRRLTALELYDSQRGVIIGLHQWFENGLLAYVDVFNLTL